MNTYSLLLTMWHKGHTVSFKPRCPELKYMSKRIISIASLLGAPREVLVKRLSVLAYILLLTVALAEATVLLECLCCINLLFRLTFALVKNPFLSQPSHIDKHDDLNC